MAITGEIISWALPTTPYGFMTCDGSIVQISDYPKLFGVIGTYYGGDGVTTFQLPDTRGRFILGTNAALPVGGNAVGTAGGTVQNTLNEVSLNVGSGTAISVASPQTISNIPPFITFKICICYDGNLPR